MDSQNIDRSTATNMLDCMRQIERHYCESMDAKMLLLPKLVGPILEMIYRGNDIDSSVDLEHITKLTGETDVERINFYVKTMLSERLIVLSKHGGLPPEGVISAFSGERKSFNAAITFKGLEYLFAYSQAQSLFK